MSPRTPRRQHSGKHPLWGALYVRGFPRPFESVVDSLYALVTLRNVASMQGTPPMPLSYAIHATLERDTSPLAMGRMSRTGSLDASVTPCTPYAKRDTRPSVATEGNPLNPRACFPSPPLNPGGVQRIRVSTDRHSRGSSGSPEHKCSKRFAWIVHVVSLNAQLGRMAEFPLCTIAGWAKA
jgi:hypothetical protein